MPKVPEPGQIYQEVQNFSSNIGFIVCLSRSEEAVSIHARIYQYYVNMSGLGAGSTYDKYK